MAQEIKTSRGTYRLEMAEGPSRREHCLSFVVNAVRSDGIERLAFRCSVAEELAAALRNSDQNAALERLAPWLVSDFDHLREAALRSVRTERRLAEFVFDHNNPGPFAV